MAHLRHLVLDVPDPVRGEDVDRGVDEVQRLVLRGFDLGDGEREQWVVLVANRRDRVHGAQVFDHQVEDLELARLGERELVGVRRVVVAGRLREAREERGLGERQIFCVLAEELAGCGLGAVSVCAVEDLVQVPLQYLIV